MPGPTVEVHVAVSAATRAAAGADVTADRSRASTSTNRITCGTRLGRARHAPLRIDEMDPGLTRLEEELFPAAVPEREHVEDPVALPRAVHPQAVTEHGHRTAAGHPVVEAP